MDVWKGEWIAMAAGLGVRLSPLDMERFAALGKAMLADPLYPSVSKIFTPEEMCAKHFLDSIAPLCIDIESWRGDGNILDLGTGGGFPALPLAILFPHRRVLAVDAREKSVAFVQRMARAIGLTNLEAVQGRAEELGRSPAFRERSDLVVCRALAAVRVLVEYCLPLVRVGGQSLFYKGHAIDQEMLEAKQALNKLRVAPEQIRRCELVPPRVPFFRGFVLIDKCEPTPDLYPRRSGQPSAKPL